MENIQNTENIISAQKVEPVIIQSYPYNYSCDKSNLIFIKLPESNEKKYERELEFKMRDEFNEFLYDSFYKRGIKPDEFIKNKLWETFKYNKKQSNNGFFNYLENLWEKFEDNYL